MRVVIVDDERLAIMQAQHILEGIEEVEVVGTYTNYMELLNDFPRLQPDAAFLDIDMPGMNGLELGALTCRGWSWIRRLYLLQLTISMHWMHSG